MTGYAGYACFRCPDCRADAALEHRELEPGLGVLRCERCGQWFPIEDHIADFTPPEAREEGRWRAFWERHGDGLGLAAPQVAATAAPIRSQREFFDGFVGDYEQIVEATPFWQGHDALAVEAWVARVPPDAQVLDLGAGSGRCTVPLAGRLRTGHVVALDISFQMLRAARAKLEQAGDAARATFVVGDATRLEFMRPGSFDVAFAYGLFHHLDEPGAAWLALGDVMRERSSVLVHDNNASGLRGAFDFLMARRRLWDAEHDGHPVVRLGDLRAWSRAAGFRLHQRTSVFVPPHLCNLLTPAASRRLLTVSDDVLSRVPGVARHGGIILAEAFRGGAPLVFPSQPRAAG
jgi:SAM-dependent methyltransferase/uncharacterized protein YbaR (Trm112 family)